MVALERHADEVLAAPEGEHDLGRRRQQRHHAHARIVGALPSPDHPEGDAVGEVLGDGGKDGDGSPAEWTHDLAPDRSQSKNLAASEPTRLETGVEVDSADAHGVLYAHGGVEGGHSLYVEDKRLRRLVGDGICVGRGSASLVTPEYTAPFAFTGGRIDKVVVDVPGEKFVDHEAQVAAWFSAD